MKIVIGTVVFVTLFMGGYVMADRSQRTDLILRPECLIKPVELIDCDVTSNPPKCAHVNVSYRASCAEIRITK
jgi:hypothetical protein